MLGGTGTIGQRAVKELCSFAEIQSITLAARSREKYHNLREQVEKGQDKLCYAEIDLNDGPELGGVMQGHDLVANAAGPSYRYEYPLAQAAIRAGVNYISICDDFDAAQRVFTLNEEARRKGLTILTGMGWTPGLSNLMVRAGADRLKAVDKIKIAWAGGTADTMGMAVILHVLHIFSGQVPSFRGGSHQMIPAGSGRERVTFPEPIGSINVYTVGHPEPITLGRYFPQAQEITLKGGINQELLNVLALLSRRLGILKGQTRRRLTATFLQKTLPFWRRLAGPKSPDSGIRVDLVGLSREGRDAHLTYSAAGPMDVLTALPLSIAIREMARGNMDKTGVLAPEAPGALNPHTFFTALEERGVQIRKGSFSCEN